MTVLEPVRHELDKDVPMQARDIVVNVPTITLQDTVAKAVQVMALGRLPGLIVVDERGRASMVLPGSQVLRLVVPASYQSEPALAHTIDEELVLVQQCPVVLARDLPGLADVAAGDLHRGLGLADQAALELAQLVQADARLLHPLLEGEQLLVAVDRLGGAAALQAALDEVQAPGDGRADQQVHDLFHGLYSPW